ncbi:histidine phosphatase family protein [Defluviimonas sp. SAOS-178_SWC]|uniref:histidine phosphatase family protein n=1 Tax=Defluviimonas sp. SAOS-178_SWC TaxID=3121287 RepID=UPI003221E645
MAQHPELYILRHGETEWNAEGRIQGRLDSRLTARGRDQARRQGEILRGAGVSEATHDFWVSPQGRAQETAAIALSGLSAAPLVDSRLREISLGPFDGLTRAEIGARYPDAFAETDPFLWYDTPPGGEGFAALAARLGAFLSEIERPAVIVAHGIVSRFLRGAVLDLDLDGIAALPGGQGVVFHLKDGVQTCLV